MKTVKVEIEGLTPLLMNRFTDETEVKISSGTSSTMRGNWGTPREQAAKTAYKDEKGNLYIPGANLFKAIIEGGRFHKIGKKQVTISNSTMITGGVFLKEVVLPLGTKKFEVDSRSVVINGKSRIMKHRARLDTWKLTFELEIDDTIFTVDFVRQFVEDAGKRIGLGDFRPDRKGQFGRFAITKWQTNGKN